jgi:hypothetical protein
MLKGDASGLEWVLPKNFLQLLVFADAFNFLKQLIRTFLTF